MLERAKRKSKDFSLGPASVAVMVTCWVWLGISIYGGYSLSHDIIGAALFSFSIGLTPVLLIAVMLWLFERKPGS